MSGDTSVVEQSNGKPAGGPGFLMRWLIRTFIGILITAAILFIPAGRPDWIMGWVYLGTFVLVTVVTALFVDQELLAERDQVKEGVKGWDKVIFGLYGLVSTVVMLPVAGLDVRFGGTTQIPLALQIGALVVYVLGWALHIWAMMSNNYFSKFVRVQQDRGQTVATGGPYRYVRHPGYVGGIVFNLATPLILGSWWALVPAALGAFLLVVRTALEDRTLREELPGYEEYAQQVRYRLLPGVW